MKKKEKEKERTGKNRKEEDIMVAFEKFPVFENQNVEFKQEYVPEIKKEVVAFANSSGGTILLGVRNDGSLYGVDDPDSVMVQIANALKDSISPDVMSFVEIRTILMEGKQVIEILVSSGTNKPYYIREKGLKPSGVYIRKGSSSQPVSEEGIREMIVQTFGRSYEECRSMNQNLSFQTFFSEMEKRGLECGEAQMRTLGMIGTDNLYTNLALLLSDQCEATTKVAIFQGNHNYIFRDRQEFSGSLLKQMEEVYYFIDRMNKTKASFSGLYRMDQRDYPEDAIREIWLNSIVHRDYSFSGSTIINIYDDKMEIVSLGGLVPGLELDSIFLGISQSRNPKLASIFYRMKLIESYGTGIGKAKKAYDASDKKPVFETAKGAFRVTLPNRNEGVVEPKTSMYLKESPASYGEASLYEAGISNPSSYTIPYLDEKRKISEVIKVQGVISRKEVEQLLHVGTTKAFHLLKEMCEDGTLSTIGNGRMK
ncbi:MAG: putative DNA binding domain-containing protein, partial [Dorea sp.]|nr:putative DNA binding domain-containing protein [Dorea sp.]